MRTYAVNLLILILASTGRSMFGKCAQFMHVPFGCFEALGGYLVSMFIHYWAELETLPPRRSTGKQWGMYLKCEDWGSHACLSDCFRVPGLNVFLAD